MEASSLELTVCRLATTLGLAVIKPVVGAGFAPTDDMLLTRPKSSSSDDNWLGFEEGLTERKVVN